MEDNERLSVSKEIIVERADDDTLHRLQNARLVTGADLDSDMLIE